MTRSFNNNGRKNVMAKALVLVLLVFPAVSMAADVSDLAWMSGSRAGPIGEQTLEENWIQPAGRTIAAVVRFTGNAGTSMTEHPCQNDHPRMNSCSPCSLLSC